jgi:hypothetical protein
LVKTGMWSTPTVVADGEQVTDGSRYDRAAFAQAPEAAGLAARPAVRDRSAARRAGR